MKNKNKKSSTGLKSLSASLLCIFGGIFVGFLVLVLLSVFNPRIGFAEAVRGILIVLGGPFSGGGNSLFQFGNMLFNATPLILTGLSACIAFKTGLFNIGAPGQYLMGAMVTLIVSLSIPSATVPAPVIWLLALICGTLAGALWGAIPGFFKAYLNVNEVIVCIMTNWIAANVVSWVFNGSKFINVAESKVNFIMKTEVNNIATATFGLDKIFSGGSVVSYADASIFLAICVAIALYIVMNKTTFGYELKACGYNRDGAKYAGMNEKRNLLLAMAIAGGLAAMGASIWCLNGHQDFKWETYQTLPVDGFNGIPAALLAGNNPIGIIFTAIFLKYINVGGSNLAANTAFNEYVSQLMVAMIVYFSGFARYISMLLSTKKKSLQEIEKEIKNSKEEKK